ncbi:MAG: spore coat protein [Bacillota bacterium]
MNDINRLNDLLQTEIKNQEQYNRYMVYIQNPEIRQMLAQLRDIKMRQITQLQQEIGKIMSKQ